VSAFLTAAMALSFAAGAPPVVSDLHTVSIHVDSVATFNALLQLLSDDFRWPVVFGQRLTGAQKDRRNYAAVWAGNVRFEICGPYPKEFQPGDSGARLHGLTFRPHETADKSALELDRREIRHRPTVTWGKPDAPLKFVIFDDPDMIAPVFSISIMDTMNQPAGQAERDRVQRELAANQGGPLGLKQVREIRVGHTRDATLRKWQRLLETGPESWPGAGGAGLRFLKHSTHGIAAAVLEVKSLEQSGRFLRGLGLAVVRGPAGLECDVRGVRFVLTE
jgi:hypothetical protein